MGRRLGIAVGLAVTIAVIAVVASNGPNTAGPVSVVLTHATIHGDWQDAVVAVNDSSQAVGYACGVNVMPRTAATFRLPPGLPVCTGRNIPVAAHSRHRVQPSIQPEPPGKYWVWFQYWRGGVGHGPVQTAYTKLTVVGENPDVSVVLAHQTVRAGSLDPVEVVNRGRFSAGGSGCGPVVTPRTSPVFTRPRGVVFCAGGGPAIAPHSHIRAAPSIATATPGKYWVWFDYFYGPAGREQIADTAYAKLTVLPS